MTGFQILREHIKAADLAFQGYPAQRNTSFSHPHVTLTIIMEFLQGILRLKIYPAAGNESLKNLFDYGRHSSRTGEKTSTATESWWIVAECATFPGMFYLSPGRISDSFSPIRSVMCPDTRYPVCSWGWVCAGRFDPMSSRNSVMSVCSPKTSVFCLMPGSDSLYPVLV